MGCDMNAMPGGGEFGRGARREVRNPILLLPAAQGILALPVESRRPLGILLRQLADQANDQAQVSWKSNKGIMAAYWKAVSVYAKHLARVIDPAHARGPGLGTGATSSAAIPARASGDRDAANGHDATRTQEQTGGSGETAA